MCAELELVFHELILKIKGLSICKLIRCCIELFVTKVGYCYNFQESKLFPTYVKHSLKSWSLLKKRTREEGHHDLEFEIYSSYCPNNLRKIIERIDSRILKS